MTHRSLPSRHLRRGYTLVELMMALALLTVSVLGIISLQKVTVVTNAHAKNLAIAQRVAQAWAAQLQMDSTEWVTNLPTSGFLNSTAGWQRLPYNPARRFGAAFDALGNPLADDNLNGARFCTHVRQRLLYPNLSVAGNGVLRAEIRVFWLRDGQAPVDPARSLCFFPQVDADISSIGAATSNYHFVYQTIALRQHYQI